MKRFPNNYWKYCWFPQSWDWDLGRIGCIPCTGWESQRCFQRKHQPLPWGVDALGMLCLNSSSLEVFKTKLDGVWSWTCTLSTIPDCSKPHPTFLWTLPGMKSWVWPPQDIQDWQMFVPGGEDTCQVQSMPSLSRNSLNHEDSTPNPRTPSFRICSPKNRGKTQPSVS